MICEQKFQLKKDGTCYKLSFCAHPELIENYDLAMADKERVWHCHHKKEEFYTSQELIDLGLYYNVPPEDLVFVKDHKEHYSWPHKGREEGYRKTSVAMQGHEVSEEAKRKNSEAHKGRPAWNKGKPQSEEAKRKNSEAHMGNPYGRAKIKVQCVETGQVFESITAARKFVGQESTFSIRDALKKPNRTAGGYHWRRA